MFPNDPLADLAERVKQSESIFFGLLESVLNGFINLQGGIKIEDKENILKAISKITNVVDNDIVLLTNAEIEDIKLLWEAKKEEFITSTSLVPIFVRLEPVDN